MVSSSLPSTAASLLLAVVSCSAPDTTATRTPAQSAEAGTVERRRDPCSEPEDQRPPSSACVLAVEGSLVDESGSPLDAPTTLCGGRLCFGGAAVGGKFRVPVGSHVNLANFAIHVDGRPEHANVFRRLAPARIGDGEIESESESEGTVFLRAALRVPRLVYAGPPLPSVAPRTEVVAAAGPVTLVLAANTSVELDFADAALEGGAGSVLRAGPVIQGDRPDPDLLALFALAPFGATLSLAAAVTIDLRALANVPPPDGTSVEFVMLDDDVDSATLGELVVGSAGTVEGGVAKTSPSGGVRRLTWIGIRKGALR